MSHLLAIDPPNASRVRVIMTYAWLVLRNILGWALILTSFVAGPLIPGPGGIPMFLVGFALITFPGKRRLTARVLRGRPIRFTRRQLLSVPIVIAIILAASALPWVWPRIRVIAGPSAIRQTIGIIVYYLLGAVVIWPLARAGLGGINLLLRGVARARRKIRPWLRRHRIRLLPPRWRVRHPHEHGLGRRPLSDEILRFHKPRA